MGQTERLYKLKTWLDSGRCVKRDAVLRALEISPATLKRDLALLRDRLEVPIVWDKEGGGWRLDKSQSSSGMRHELPGLWFSAQELHALLTMQHLLAQLDVGGLLGPHIEPLRQRIERALDRGVPPGTDLARHIRVLPHAARKIHLPHFQAIGSAVLQRKRIRVRYHHRARDETNERELSPQRLAHYRDNWYLDAWCHTRGALRTFSVDAITAVDILATPAIDLPPERLDHVLGAGYGIFAGTEVRWAVLRFSPEKSRWVAAEHWHPEQRGRRDHTGCWVLEVPYTDPRELVMDILRHVPDVEVLAPPELAEEVVKRLRQGLLRLGSRCEPGEWEHQPNAQDRLKEEI